MSDVQKGWLCHRVLRWQEPTAALDDSGPHRLQVFDSELGLWLTLAQVDVEEDAMAQGIPVLRGPYVVDFSDIPHDGDTVTLWTPQVGDVLLRLFPDVDSVTNWDRGQLFIAQDVAAPSSYSGTLAWSQTGNIGAFGQPGTLDLVGDPIFDGGNGPPGGLPPSAWGPIGTARVFHTDHPVQIRYINTTGIDPIQGHVALYALVARAVAP